MTLMMKDGAILKTDVLGRLKTPKARREEILDEFEASGLSGLKFAELVGMKYPTFASWIQNRRRKRKEYPARKPAKPKAIGWLEAVMDKEENKLPKTSAILLRLSGGAEVRIEDSQQIKLAAELIRALQGQGAPAC